MRRILSYKRECPGCKLWFSERDMRVLYGTLRLCAQCWPAWAQECSQACDDCGRIFYDETPREVCGRCAWRRPGHEERRVRAQNSRARGYGRPATLTLAEWARTLEDFNGKCAYCLEADFSVLEHVFPIQVRGTTRANCVPACASCNARKQRGRAQGIPTTDIQRVLSYLEARAYEAESYRDELANLIAYMRR